MWIKVEPSGYDNETECWIDSKTIIRLRKTPNGVWAITTELQWIEDGTDSNAAFQISTDPNFSIEKFIEVLEGEQNDDNN